MLCVSGAGLEAGILQGFGRRWKVDPDCLGDLRCAAWGRLVSRERARGVIWVAGLLGLGRCFRCAEFEDYAGSCSCRSGSRYRGERLRRAPGLVLREAGRAPEMTWGWCGLVAAALGLMGIGGAWRRGPVFCAVGPLPLSFSGVPGLVRSGRGWRSARGWWRIEGAAAESGFGGAGRFRRGQAVACCPAASAGAAGQVVAEGP